MNRRCQPNSHLLRMIFFVITVTLTVNLILSGASGTSQKPEQSGVDALVRAKFKRIPGKAYGGAVLDTGGPNSWYSHYVGSPTVDFDGQMYRLWFVGGAKTTDTGVPYGAYERVGLAESADGIEWKLANEGKPVLDLGNQAAEKNNMSPQDRRHGRSILARRTGQSESAGWRRHGVVCHVCARQSLIVALPSIALFVHSAACLVREILSLPLGFRLVHVQGEMIRTVVHRLP